MSWWFIALTCCVMMELLYKKWLSLLSGRWAVTSEHCVVSKKCRTESPCWIKLVFSFETTVSWRREANIGLDPKKHVWVSRPCRGWESAEGPVHRGAGTRFWSPGHRGRQKAEPIVHGKNYHLLVKREVLATPIIWTFKSIEHCNKSFWLKTILRRKRKDFLPEKRVQF